MFIQYPNGIAPFEVACNVDLSGLFSNVRSSVARGLPEVTVQPAKEAPAIIVGGGPSLSDTFERIKEIKADGGVIFALNNTAKYLAERGIKADYQIVLDARKENAEFVKEPNAGTCLIASQCHPDLFEACSMPIMVWHAIIEKLEEELPHKPVMIGGGTTVGLSGMCLAYTMGYRIMHLFGYDSSYQDDQSHAYEQALNKDQQTLKVTVNNRTFKASVAMSAQAQKFPHLALELAELGCEIYPHGDGLLQHVVKTMQDEGNVKVLTAVYDLAASPPTYDFISFLGEAEKARIEGGFTCLDVVFQPGPMFGFRDDNLPPSIAEREAMLHRICVSSCRLLPSVRNVEVLKTRKDIEGNVFPALWRNDFPMSHYGTRFAKTAPKCLRASASAKNLISKEFSNSFITVTLRQANYWPERNSNIAEWNKAINQLRKDGYEVVIIPDSSSNMVAYTPAAWDVDIRMALYEKAVVNLMVSNGPFALCLYSNAKYLLFKPIAKNCPSATAEFLLANGVNIGDNYGDNGRVIWEDDEAETIIRETRNFLRTQLLEVIHA